MEELKSIGIFGHYGNKNLGDEAIIQSVLQNIRQRRPETLLVGFSINPGDTAMRYGIDAYPIRRMAAALAEKTPERHDSAAGLEKNQRQVQGLVPKIKSRIKTIPLLGPAGKAVRRAGSFLTTLVDEATFLHTSYKRLKTIDVLMITGSNQFLDNFGGPWGFPYTLLKWSAIARIAGTKVYYVSVGAGPISQPLSKTFIRWALRFADYISLRDASSARLIQEIGCKSTTHVYPDLAHSMPLEQISAASLPFVRENRELPVVGINPMPLYDSRYWCEVDQQKYSDYVAKMVDFSGRLLDRNYPLFFFATQEKDNYVIEDILKDLETQRQVVMPFDTYVLTSSTVDELMANIAAADITVATRFHGTVLSLLSGKPMLGVCYYRKASELLMEMGQQNYAVELDTFLVDDLWRRFEILVQNRLDEKNKIQIKNSEYLDSLNAQYDLLFLPEG